MVQLFQNYRGLLSLWLQKNRITGIKQITIIVKSIPLGLWLAFWLGITGILVASVLFFIKESWPALFIIPAGLMPAIFLCTEEERLEIIASCY